MYFVQGIKIVIAESYERIHRSNLVGMGILPLQYLEGQNAESLGLTGRETFSVPISDDVKPKQNIVVTVSSTKLFCLLIHFLRIIILYKVEIRILAISYNQWDVKYLQSKIWQVLNKAVPPSQNRYHYHIILGAISLLFGTAVGFYDYGLLRFLRVFFARLNVCFYAVFIRIVMFHFAVFR